MDKLEFVKSTSTWDSGGGILLDLVYLKDGTILAISGEAIVLYVNQEDLEGGEDGERPCIFRKTHELAERGL